MSLISSLPRNQRCRVYYNPRRSREVLHDENDDDKKVSRVCLVTCKQGDTLFLLKFRIKAHNVEDVHSKSNPGFFDENETVEKQTKF